MLIRTRLYGSGTDRDPFRALLPTYHLVHGNITHGFALVSVPEEVHGLTAEDLKHETVEETTEGKHYPELCDGCIDKMHKHMDSRYAEHKGRFRVEKV